MITQYLRSNIRIALLFSLMIVSFTTLPLYAGIESYFKKVPNKSNNHSMRNIDFIYMINLDQRPEKFAQSLNQLEPYGIRPYRFSAVNGWELSLLDINNLGVAYTRDMTQKIMGTSYLPSDEGKPRHGVIENEGQTYFCHCMARGPIGIVLSHLSILQDALDSGYKTIWVMEDDIQVIRNPRILSSLVKELDSLVGRRGWDILFTDQDTKNQKGEYVPCRGYAKRPNFTPSHPERFAQVQDIGSQFRKIGARYGAYSMIIRRSGMQKILNFIKNHKIFLPYDMDFYLPNDIRMFAVKEDVVSTMINALSDNGSPAYLNKKENLVVGI